MVHQVEFSLPPFRRGFHLITELVVKNLPELPETGVLHLFIKHTSAGICINENSAREVLEDFEIFFNKLVPEGEYLYRHYEEGKDDMPGHIKSVLSGNSIDIPVTHGKLNLGTWQGIYLCEFRNNGGARKLVATILG
ncbi:MAG TPA: secondary thiamine-phosphate synthase enzyme YjbQ [Lentimicrobium sp.]|nr:secondary thiamine-phosphate synthase enzyme YjbQ [Lentimicrobium sp.]